MVIMIGDVPVDLVDVAAGVVTGAVVGAVLASRFARTVLLAAAVGTLVMHWWMDGMAGAVALVSLVLRGAGETGAAALVRTDVAAAVAVGAILGVLIGRRRGRRSAEMEDEATAAAETRSGGIGSYAAVAVGLLVAMLIGWLVGAGLGLPTAAELREIATRSQIVVDASILERGDKRAFLDHAMCRCPIVLASEDIPQHARDALVAAEDRRFLDHIGLDWIGKLRALANNLRRGRIAEGGSTIGEQIAKALLTTGSRGGGRFWEKVVEARAARSLENMFTKDELLDLYLNRIDFGSDSNGPAFGIEMAARKYFGKPARDLNLYEAAMLVGAANSPTRFNPLRRPQAAHGRARRVLGRMVTAGFVSDQEAGRAIAAGIERGGLPPVRLGTGYYLDWAYDELRASVRERGLTGQVRFVVALDPLAQKRASRLIAKAVAENAHRAVGAGALVAMTPGGKVTAMVGGVDHRRSQFNRAAARRQPASTFKLFVYLPALERGRRPDDIVLDAPLAHGWPRNFDGAYRGRVELHDAFAHSYNAAAVQLAEEVGLDEVAAMARRLGIGSPLAINRALALGASETTLIELTATYAALANEGRAARPRATMLALAGSGRVIAREPWRPAERLLEPEVVSDMRAMLAATVSDGTGRAARIPGRWVGGKTGTSERHRDALFVGLTNDLVTGIWFGNDDSAPMAGVTGGSLPAAAWRALNTTAR